MKEYWKNILSILLISVLFIGCGENRVPYDDLTNKGTDVDPEMYYENKLFSGTAFGEINEEEYYSSYEEEYINGKRDGKCRGWYKNGNLLFESKWKNGKGVGAYK